MKKLLTFCAFLSAALLVASCGASKKNATVNTLGVEEMKSPAQVYAEEAPDNVQRAWASYNDFDPTVANRGAAALARAELASQIGIIVQNAIDIYRGKFTQNVSDGSKAKQVTDGGGEAGDEVKAASEELVQGSKIVKSNTYLQKDGTRTAYVCVEVNIDMIMENVKNNQKLMHLISEQEKEMIEQEKQEFEEDMREAFSNYRKMRGRE